ncbi:MAG TPA: PilT/PilU family type 4a pilus ATPase [Thermoanaerobaculia bacterium]|nr:PilT/PilU family type 4a pilus ATPase [Thermoanaerobaculia bacterium]
MTLSELLKFMAKKEASDLHLKPMRPPLLRIKGRLIPLNADALQPKDLEEMLLSILTPAQKERLEAHQSVDVGYGLTGVARFRCNIFVQRGSYAAVFRRIPFKLPSITELNLPDVLESFVHLPKGLVLITGPTGSGKSTSLAGIMRSIIEKRPVHIVTIEDPIEFLFADGKAAVSQREVSTDSPSFNEALKNMFRQDPDVIMVGEMRDWNTMQTAITAAETGHLVFSTLHTNSAAQSIDRIIDSCPIEQQTQVRSQLSIVLQAIVSMNLIETSDGTGRAPVVEIMVNSPKIQKHILSGEVKEIHEEIENSVNYYKMQSMNQSLIALLVNRRITYAKAMELSTDPEDLSLKLRKLFPQIEEDQRGGLMASDSDFSQITQLLEIKRLYEEQEEKFKLRLTEKDEEVNKYMMELRDQKRVIEGRDQVLTDMESDNSRLKADAERINREFQAKIAQLNDRIKELNQRLMLAEGGGRAAAGQGGAAGGGGFFKK